LFVSNIVGMAVSRRMMCVGLVIRERGRTFSWGELKLVRN
jgi:hypothetical protein